jgi:hypothetical protein
MRRVVPTVLARLARSSWWGHAAPAPELGQIETWPPSKSERDTPARPRRIDESREERQILAPVPQEDRPLEARAAHKDVVRRSRMYRRGENEHRRQSGHKSCSPSHRTNYTSNGSQVPGFATGTFETARRVCWSGPTTMSLPESEHTAITRPSISISLLLLVIAMALTTLPPVARTARALVSADATRRSHVSASAVILRDFLLRPSGILFGMHPTEARIVIIAAAAAPLKVCQLGTTFSTYWKGGCRRLVGRPLALPTSGGAVHIGFRVLPWTGRTTRVLTLRVRWHCVDHYFALLRGTTRVRSASPMFDC